MSLLPHMTSFTDIQQAAALLQGIAHHTPIHTSRQLNARAGASVFLKCENFQRVGAFKFRGAYHAIARLSPEEKARPIITVSSGNHAQGVALACQLQGLAAHVVMAEPVNPIKRDAVLGYGATIHSAPDRDHADRLGHELVEEFHGVFIHPYNHPHVIAGQGTVALEMLHHLPDLDVLLGPIGGGGLLSGTCVAAHGINPHVHIYACEPAGALDALHSVRENRIVPMPYPQTIAEGLRTSVGDVTLPILREHLAGFFVVEEREIVEAMRFVFERMKIVIEPSSAVAVAPLLRMESSLTGKRVGVIITGGNVDMSRYFAHVHESGDEQ